MVIANNMREAFKHGFSTVAAGRRTEFILNDIQFLRGKYNQRRMSESLISCVIRRFQKLLSSESRISQAASEKLERILSKLKNLQAISRIADARHEEDERIHEWVTKTRELAYETEDVLDNFVLGLSKNERSFRRRPSEKKLKTLLDVESKIASQETDWKICNIGNSLEEATNYGSRSRTHPPRGDGFVGLDEDIKNLVSEVVKENGDGCFHVVSIVGIGGIGKSSLARKIYHHSAVRSRFEAFAWAHISRKWDPEDVLHRILCHLEPEKRGQIDNMNFEELIITLYDVQKTKSCLVVLDDICETNVWSRLRRAFPTKKLRSKVLVTTRKEEIARHIDTDTNCIVYEQRPLNEEESWQLLQNKVFPEFNISVENEEYDSGNELEGSTPSIGSFRSCVSDEEDEDFSDNFNNSHFEDGTQDTRADKEKLEMEIIAHCGGLPLAIIDLADILKTKSTLSEWEAMYQNFNSYLMGRNLGENQKILKELALIYHDLPYRIKQCFWLLGNFPRDYIIPTRKLYQLWAAEGFLLSDIHPGEEEELSMEIAESYLRELMQRNMVQVQVDLKGCMKSCRLHDFIREICIFKGNEVNYLKEIPVSEEPELDHSSSSSSRTLSTNTSRRLSFPVDSLSEVNSTSEHGDHDPVRSAMFFPMLTERKQLQQNLQLLCDDYKLLRILDLERFNLGDELYESIGNLIHMRYLSLRGCLFRRLPSSIGNLRFLQTLDLRVAFDAYLIIPDVIWKLNQLRHLYLPPCQNSSNKLQLNSLSNLKILKNFDPRVSNFTDISKLSKLRKLTVIFCFEIEKYLRINSNHISESSFRVHYNFKTSKDIILLEQLVRCVHLQKLDLVGQIKKLPELHHFSQKLAKLTLRSSSLKEDPMPVLEKLPNLCSLILRNNAFVGRKIRCSQRGFGQLRTLEFQGLMDLEEWRVEEGSMPKLLFLTIESCAKLKMLPHGLKLISTIRKMVIANMPEAFKQTVVRQDGGPNAYEVVFSDTKQVPNQESRNQRGSSIYDFFRTIGPSAPTAPTGR